jgi:hypothetical protein
MMSASDCRARASVALIRAEDAPDSETKRHWERMARHWVALAVRADAHEALERALIGQESDFGSD